MAKKNQIKSFTSKGGSVSGISGTGLKPASMGHFDPTTGQVYQHPRVKADPLAGSSVRVTNSKASGPASNQRTQSLGMGAVGQQHRYR